MKPILRGGNADLNMTLAMSLVFFVLWIVWSLQSLGPAAFCKHIFSGGDNGKGVMAIFMIAIFLFVGIIEVISITFRPVSLSFRLYGNVFAGENILESMMHLVPWLGWILAACRFIFWNCWWVLCRRWFSRCSLPCSRH